MCGFISIWSFLKGSLRAMLCFRQSSRGLVGKRQNVALVTLVTMDTFSCKYFQFFNRFHCKRSLKNRFWINYNISWFHVDNINIRSTNKIFYLYKACFDKVGVYIYLCLMIYLHIYAFDETNFLKIFDTIWAPFHEDTHVNLGKYDKIIS